MRPDEIWMLHAIELAKKAQAQKEVPVGALLVFNGKVIGEGFNQREHSHSTLGHAELAAIKSFNETHSAWRVPEGTTLYSTVEPCVMCTGALLQARVSRIVFGCADTKNAGLLRLMPDIQRNAFDHRFQEVKAAVLEKNCQELIRLFFQNKRKELAISKLKSRSLYAQNGLVDPHHIFPQV